MSEQDTTRESSESEVTEATASDEPGQPDDTGQSTESDQDEADGQAPVNALETALAEAEKFRDLALRGEAEMQNVRRRAERDVENAHKFAIERTLTSLLPVVDSLEKAIEASQSEDDPVIEGVRLTFKLLQDLLAKENVEVVDPAGEPFDPNEHQAMSAVENPDMEPNSVCAVIQKGYKLNGRVVRPAMVMVTKAPATQ